MEIISLAVLAAVLAVVAFVLIRLLGRSRRNDDTTEGGGLEGATGGIENADHL